MAENGIEAGACVLVLGGKVDIDPEEQAPEAASPQRITKIRSPSKSSKSPEALEGSKGSHSDSEGESSKPKGKLSDSPEARRDGIEQRLQEKAAKGGNTKASSGDHLRESAHRHQVAVQETRYFTDDHGEQACGALVAPHALFSVAARGCLSEARESMLPLLSLLLRSYQ